MTQTLYTGRKSAELIDYLLHRRSGSPDRMAAPAPDKDQVETILRAAMRVPDHGKMFPWYFIVLEGDARSHAGKLLGDAWKAENPDQAEPAKVQLEAERFLRAPMVIIAVSRIREGKHPQWEQILSAGAACQNLCLAANALGFATKWLTEWSAYSPGFTKALGLDPQDAIAGVIYMGTPAGAGEERARPEPAELITYWQPDVELKKGESYGNPGKGFPRAGYKFAD